MIANQGYHLFDLHDEGRALVLGLSWQPLLGKDLAKNSRRIALAEKASHYVAGDNSCAAVGVINLRAEPSDPSRRDLYSAAAIFARENKQGVNIACVEIPDSEGQLVWVVACLDGVIIKGTDRVCSQQVAEHLLLELRTRYKFSMTRDVVLEKLGASVGFGRLEECKTTLQSIPGFAKIGFAAVLALLVCNAGFEKWKAYEAEKERENHIELHVDAQALWKAQLGNWAKTQKMDGPAGLSAIYQHIASTPIRVGNWQLAGVTCTASNSGWKCRAMFARATGGNNDTFVSSAPKNWSIGWDGLGRAIASWDFNTQRNALSLSDVPDAKELSTGFIAQLQNVLPAFNQVKVMPESALVVPEPKVRNSRNEVKAIPFPGDDPQGLRIPKYQQLEFAGPMRSLSVLPVAPMTRFTSIDLQVNNDIVTEASMEKSMLMIDLKGVMYVY